MNKIWGNTIVKNEDRFIWFALMSVIDYLDKILVFDTGSSDKTIEIIKEVIKRKPGKIFFREIGNVDEKSFTKARQKMLDQTKSDWLFILDGDEIWWEKSIKRIVSTINQQGDELDLIVNPYYSVVGDIYHYQEEAAGDYHLFGKKGHLNIRAINRKITGLHLENPYGQEGYYDEQGNKVQDRDQLRQIYLDAPYLHFSNIQRSTLPGGDRRVMQRQRKIRHEMGIKFAEDFKYPEVFYRERPEIVASPWGKMSTSFKIRSAFETPLRKIKRRL